MFCVLKKNPYQVMSWYVRKGIRLSEHGGSVRPLLDPDKGPSVIVLQKYGMNQYFIHLPRQTDPGRQENEYKQMTMSQ